MTHTPEPWTVGITFDRGWPTYRLRDMVHKAETEGFSAEMQANARLIAAAPKLLEACKAVDAYMLAAYPENMKLKMIANALVEQAIAKAKGE